MDEHKHNLDQKIGAEFEENIPEPKVEIQNKAMVKKPEYLGDTPNDGGESEKPGLTSTLKSTTLKPDMIEEDSTVEEIVPEKKRTKDTSKDPVKDQNIQNLVDSKTYFVPVGQVTKRRNTKIIFGLILILVILGIAGFVLMSSASK